MDRPKVRDQARNRWKSILPILAVDSGFLTGKHGPCPMCEGRDRWRFDDKDGAGTWICSKCGSGDGIALVMAVLKLDFREAAKTVEAVLGNISGSAPPAQNNTRDPAKDRTKMNAVWTSGRPVDATSVAGRYLAARTGLTAFSASLRAVAKLPHWAPDERIPTHHPALIAKVTDSEGKPVNIHRTYLGEDGGKADLPAPRKAMNGEIAHGAAIRLAEYEDMLGIAEGIETALSATVLHHVPCWAAVTAIGLEQWKPPPGVRVVIFGDNDPSWTGHKSAYALAYRLTKEGYHTDVMIPTRLGSDWNDVLRLELAAKPQSQAA